MKKSTYLFNKSRLIGIKSFLLIFVIFLLLVGCDKKIDNDHDDPNSYMVQKDASSDKNINTDDNIPDNAKEDDEASIDVGIIQAPQQPNIIVPEGSSLDTRILTPEGYSRVPSEAYEITGFIRTIPLKDDGSQVIKFEDRKSVV